MIDIRVQEKRWTGTWWKPWTWRREWVTVGTVPMKISGQILKAGETTKNGDVYTQECIDDIAEQMRLKADELARQTLLDPNPLKISMTANSTTVERERKGGKA